MLEISSCFIYKLTQILALFEDKQSLLSPDANLKKNLNKNIKSRRNKLKYYFIAFSFSVVMKQNCIQQFLKCYIYFIYNFVSSIVSKWCWYCWILEANRKLIQKFLTYQAAIIMLFTAYELILKCEQFSNERFTASWATAV